MAQVPQGPSDEFDSRKKIENEIMEDLRGGKVHMMGICGMGGVGKTKTTMAKRIMNRVREEKLFEEVLMVVISREVRELEIQGEIAEKLGLELKENSLSGRASRLSMRLRDAKRKLLILDDIWEKLDLERLGIPCKSDEGKGCTILLTSRNRDVLSKMNAKHFGVQILTEQEALTFFRGKVGTCAGDADLLGKAEEVVKECKGLPLALAAVGAALKGTSIEHWNDALIRLKRPNSELPEYLAEIYNPIKLSYDFLEIRDRARSLFLLCSLFPEDCDIDLEYLMMYCKGLGMFADEITTLEEARDRVHVLVDRLKSCFLLLDGSDKNHVKMHDDVRDVAIYIASEEGLIVSKLTASGREESINCKWISVVGKEINKLHIWSSFPSLRLLKIDNYSAGVNNTEASFLKGMIELNVLSFHGFSSLPETTQLLKNLRTLYLEACFGLETISIVGELLSLEILICRWCDSIAELPVEIERLKKLRMLKVNYCRNLKRIAPEVISNLVQLEELVILDSFNEWETKAPDWEQRENAALCEIEHLENLTRLEIDIKNPTLTAEEIRFPSKIVKFAVKVGGKDYCFDESPYERQMSLSCKGDSTFGKWIHVLLTTTEYLSAKGEGANNFDISQAKEMKRLRLYNCSKVNKLVNITPSMDWSVGVFPLLESLTLNDLPNLEEICVGPIPKSSNSFGNLKELRLFKCIKLRKLFPLSIAKDGLLQIEILEINECKMMEHVFDEMDREECQKITFPKLKTLRLSSLSSLISFYKGSESIEFPLLEAIHIFVCPKLKSLSSSIGDSRNLTDHDDFFYVFFNQKVIFHNLVEIDIRWCHGIRILFSSSTAVNLDKLKKLHITWCDEMVKVIEDDDDVLCEEHSILFPSLKELFFYELPKLQIFCNWRCELELPSLESVEIRRCPSLEFFTMKSVIFHNLVEIEIRMCDGIKVLFSASTARNLVNLKKLKIHECLEMVKVIEDDDDVLCDKHRILFPSLKQLHFFDLPKLQIFCNWRCELELPSLESVDIRSCPLLEFFTIKSVLFPCLKSLEFYGLPKLQSFGNGRCEFELPSLESIEISKCPLFLEFFTMNSVGFHSLKEIMIRGCNYNQSLFLSSIAKTLVNLKELKINDCRTMVKVIEDDDDMSCEKPLLLSPCLKELWLQDLPKLESFCNWKCDLKLSSLERLYINRCPLLAFFTMGNVTTPNLKRFTINGENRSSGDLNTVIKRHFNSGRLEEIGEGGHTFIEESTSAETKGVEAHNEKIETQVEETIEENDEM